MFCRPIKIQSFDNQTSTTKFTRPLWNVLTPLQRWPVSPSTKTVPLILTEVSSSSFLLAFASSRLDLKIVSSFPQWVSHALNNLRLLVGEETSLVFDTLQARRGDFFPCRRFQIWFRALLVTHGVGVVWCFTAIYSQAFLTKKIMFKTGLCGVQSRFREKMKIVFCPADTTQTMLRWTLFFT